MDNSTNNLKTPEKFIEILDYYGIKIDPNKPQQNVLCPFHDDHKPSLAINLEEGVFNCFGCDSKGDMFAFVALQEGLSCRADFHKVVEKVQQICGIEPAMIKTESSVSVYDYKVDGEIVNQKIKPPDKPMYFSKRKANGGQFPIYNVDILKDTKEVVLAEGEKDAETLLAQGIKAVSFPFGAETVHDEFITPLLTLEKLYIAYDADEAGQKGTKKIVEKLKQHRFAGQIFTIQWGNGKKAGYDVTDWFSENTGEDKTKAFYGLFSARDISQSLAMRDTEQDIQAKAETKNLALTIAQGLLETFDLKMIYGELHSREGNIYVPVKPDKKKRNMVMDYLCANGYSALVRKSAIEEIIYLLESSNLVPDDQVNPDKYFPVQNGFLKINQDGKVELFNDTRLVFTFASQLSYIADFDTSKIVEFLSLVIPSERERKKLLEALVFVLFPWFRKIVNFDDFYFLKGYGDNGKSILTESIISPIVGHDTISNIRYQDFEDKFAMANIVGKRFNLSVENNVVYVAENDKIKGVASGSIQQIRQIYQRANSVMVFAVIFICVNKDLLFGNLSHAMKKRIVIIDFPNIFQTNSVDPKFEADPELRDLTLPKVKELQQGLLTMILETAERLYKERRLTKTDPGEIDKIQRESDHIIDFVLQKYDFDLKSRISWDVLFDIDYKGNYCPLHGIYDPNKGVWTDPDPKYDRAARNSSQLSRRLMRLFSGKLTRDKSGDGRFVWGLKHKPGHYLNKGKE